MQNRYTKEQLEYFKNNFCYTDNGFFNLKGYIEEVVGANWRNKSFSFIIQAERNMGKSYGTWEFIEKEIWIKSNFTERIAYLRTNLTKLKPIKSFFNSKYKGRYLMTDTHIWKVEFDEQGKEIKENRIELGVVVGVMNEENWRSGEFSNYRLIFWDEYNEATQQDSIYEHWVNLFKTIERKQPNLIAILVGNKIDESNDILVNLEIELPDYIEQKDDYLIKVQDKKGEDRIYFIDISKDTFKHLDQDNQLANVWATFNEKTDIFLNKGGYLNRLTSDVLVYRKRIEPSKQIKYFVSFEDKVYEYGEFDRGVYFRDVREPEPGYKVLALDTLGGIMWTQARGLYDKRDYEDLAQSLAIKSKAKQLFYNTYETKRHLERFIIRHASMYDI